MASIPGSPIGCGGTNDHACTATSGANRRRASSAPQRSASRDASDPSTPTTIAPLTPSGYNDSPAKRRSVTWISWPRMAASRVTVYDVGPRDGLQNEPEILDVDVRAELVRRLADAGVPGDRGRELRRPAARPADGGRGGGRRSGRAASGTRPRRARPERARLRAARRDRPRRGAVRVRRHGVVQPAQPGRRGRGLDRDGAAHRRARAWRRHPLRGHAQRRVRLPVRGRGRSRAVVVEIAERVAEVEPDTIHPRRHDRRRDAERRALARQSASSSSAVPSAATSTTRATPGMRTRSRRSRRARRCSTRRSAASGAARSRRRDGQHRDRGPRLRARARRRARPASTSTASSGRASGSPSCSDAASTASSTARAAFPPRYELAARGRTAPRTSASSSSPARPRSTTSSPSSRNVRVEPSASPIGCSPFHVSSMSEPSLPCSGPGDRPGSEQVAGRDRRAVHGRMRELLRHRPVEAACVRPRDDRAAELDLELDVERPVALGHGGTAAAPDPAAAPGRTGPRAARAASPRRRSTSRTTFRGTGRAAGTPRPGCRARSSR